MFPPASHPTEAPLTTSPLASHDFSATKVSNGRIYAMGGGVAALVALCIFAFALSRPAPKTTPKVTSAPPPPVMETAAIPQPEEAVPAGEPGDVELPADPAEPSSSTKSAPATVNQSRPRPVFRPRPPTPAPAPKASGPKYTSQPRY